MIISCVSDQSERLACHVTHIHGAFTVRSQRAAHHRPGVASAPLWPGCICMKWAEHLYTCWLFKTQRHLWNMKTQVVTVNVKSYVTWTHIFFLTRNLTSARHTYKSGTSQFFIFEQLSNVPTIWHYDQNTAYEKRNRCSCVNIYILCIYLPVSTVFLLASGKSAITIYTYLYTVYTCHLGFIPLSSNIYRIAFVLVF